MLSIFNTPAPNISISAAQTIVMDAYGLDLSATALTSERDQNYLLKKKAEPKYVLKISKPAESFDVLEMQHAALAHIYLHDPEIQLPRPVNTLDGELIFHHETASNEKHYIRMVEYVPGELMKDLGKQTNGLINDLGYLLGRLDLALQGFEHPAARRSFPWNVAQTDFLINNQDNIRSEEDQLIIQHFLQEYEKNIVPISHELNKAVIHNDGNDYNVLLNDNGHISGVIDFGDMAHTFLASELAVAITYLILEEAEPETKIKSVVQGFQSVYPLRDEEIESLIHLVCVRACFSVVTANYRKKLFPENKYISVTEPYAWTFLKNFADKELSNFKIY